MSRRILVTGGLGFIGSNFITYLLEGGSDSRVVNLDRLSCGSSRANLAALSKSKRYRFVRGDITDKLLVSKLIRNADVVVNFAAESHVDRSIANASSFLRANVIGVQTILEAMRVAKSEVLFIQIGTDEEYGDIARGSFKEDDRLTPSSPYAASKAAASMLIQAYHRTYGLKTIISRCTNNFGPYQFPEKLIPKTIIRAIMGMKVPVYGSGKNIRDWIYVREHCDAINRISLRGRAGQIYNVSTGNEVKNMDVVSAILEILGKPSGLIEHVEDRPGHDLRYSLNSSKIRSELGWRPRRTFQEALAGTVEWYTKNASWWKPLADAKVLHPAPWKLRW